MIFWVVLFTVFIVGFAAFLESDYWEDETIQKLKKAFKFSIITLIVSSLMYVVIPSKDVMYEMLVAKYVTYENVDKATNTIKDSVDYIFDKLDGDNGEK